GIIFGGSNDERNDHIFLNSKKIQITNSKNQIKPVRRGGYKSQDIEIRNKEQKAKTKENLSTVADIKSEIRRKSPTINNKPQTINSS
ncbi:MAG TPA: hypothetical protein VFV68_12475, partial [Agriterribacter sp.]|nr:hypothetical protein [Agriterribacter sp.]